MTTTLAVEGMSCNHCVQAVEKALQNHTGVRSATVHLDTGQAVVEYDEREVVPEQLVAAVEAQGYEAAVGGADSAR